MLMVANAYLSNDFEYSLRVSLQDVSYVANSRIFEGNILRYRALASLKMFEYGFNESTDDCRHTFESLTNAIDNIENALIIYKTEDLE